MLQGHPVTVLLKVVSATGVQVAIKSHSEEHVAALLKDIVDCTQLSSS